MKRTLLLAAAVLLASTAWAADPPAGRVDPKAAFARIKTLAGNWDGKGEGGMQTPVSYRVTANGSVVMETLFPGSGHEMVTMYHLAGGDLVATHYCAGGNQPHFKLDTERSTPDDLVLTFDGGTNLDPAKDSFMHDGRLAFTADGHLDETWGTYDGGKAAGAHAFHLARVGK